MSRFKKDSLTLTFFGSCVSFQAPSDNSCCTCGSCTCESINKKSPGSGQYLKKISELFDQIDNFMLLSLPEKKLNCIFCS